MKPVNAHLSIAKPRFHFFLLFLSALMAPGNVSAAAASAKLIEKAPPESIAAPLREQLQAKAVQVSLDEKPVFEFWFVREASLKAKPASAQKSLDVLKPLGLLGAISVLTDQRDYKDDELFAGIYTARFGLQLQDGNHLGTADFPYFMVLVPATADGKAEGFPSEKALHKASSKETSTDHPHILSLRPCAEPADSAPQVITPAPDHSAFAITIPGKIDASSDPAAVAFEVVFKGKGKK